MTATPSTVSDRLHRRFERPDVGDYERRKGVTVARPRRPGHGVIRQRSVCDLHSLFTARLHALIRGSELPGIYPGRYVPALGRKSMTRDRGASFFAQSTAMHQARFRWDEAVVLPGGDLSAALKSSPGWPWMHSPAPQLREVETRCPGDDVTGVSRAHLYVEKIDAIVSDMRSARQCGSAQQLLATLDLVRISWDAAPVDQHQFNLHKAQLRALVDLIPALARRDLLAAAAFEIDAFLSFSAMQHAHDSIFASWFDGNFVTVLSRRLKEIQLTERCENGRLFEELLNLGQTKFAPIVINEYDTVSDGNHRLTSCWLWNALKFCQEETWCLTDSSFQKRVAEFIEREKPTPALAFELLSHLSAFLVDGERAGRLDETLRPILRTQAAILNIPVVALPEYLSGAVQKEAYDSGHAILSCHHGVYKHMKENPHTVLKPRASYHFTDAVLLPWFSVLHSHR